MARSTQQSPTSLSSVSNPVGLTDSSHTPLPSRYRSPPLTLSLPSSLSTSPLLSLHRSPPLSLNLSPPLSTSPLLSPPLSLYLSPPLSLPLPSSLSTSPLPLSVSRHLPDSCRSGLFDLPSPNQSYWAAEKDRDREEEGALLS